MRIFVFLLTTYDSYYHDIKEFKDNQMNIINKKRQTTKLILTLVGNFLTMIMCHQCDINNNIIIVGNEITQAYAIGHNIDNNYDRTGMASMSVPK